MKTATLDRLHGIALIALMSCRHSKHCRKSRFRQHKFAANTRATNFKQNFVAQTEQTL